MTTAQAKQIFEQHKRTGEPLAEDEILGIVASGLAGETDFDYTGGGLYRYNGPGMPLEDQQIAADYGVEGKCCSCTPGINKDNPMCPACTAAVTAAYERVFGKPPPTE